MKIKIPKLILNGFMFVGVLAANVSQAQVFAIQKRIIGFHQRPAVNSYYTDNGYTYIQFAPGGIGTNCGTGEYGFVEPNDKNLFEVVHVAFMSGRIANIWIDDSYKSIGLCKIVNFEII